MAIRFLHNALSIRTESGQVVIITERNEKKREEIIEALKKIYGKIEVKKRDE